MGWRRGDVFAYVSNKNPELVGQELIAQNGVSYFGQVLTTHITSRGLTLRVTRDSLLPVTDPVFCGLRAGDRVRYQSGSDPFVGTIRCFGMVGRSTVLAYVTRDDGTPGISRRDLGWAVSPDMLTKIEEKEDKMTGPEFSVGGIAGAWVMLESEVNWIKREETTKVDMMDGRIGVGAVLRWTAEVERRGSRFSIGCKMADANTLLDAPEVRNVVFKADGGATFTFQAEVKHDGHVVDGAPNPSRQCLQVELAGNTATLDELDSYGKDFVLVKAAPEPVKKVTVTYTCDLSRAKNLLGELFSTPYAADLHTALDAAIREVEA